MCGINGIVDFSLSSSKEELMMMTRSLQHRGPDDEGNEWLVKNKYTVGLGHRRLSILDLSAAGHQPMHKHGNWITYNGEIYNFLALQKELIQAGYSFQSSCDTEVILSAYDFWGAACVERFKGMFAYALYDTNHKQIILARDRAGMKPLYYYHTPSTFLFASELKAFHQIKDFKKQIDDSGLASYFQNGFIPSPKTIFQDCYKLFQGQQATLNLDTKTLTVKEYWTVTDQKTLNTSSSTLSDQQIIDKTEDLLITSCGQHMVSDVPVGLFLSGGFDSSTTAAILQKHHTNSLQTFTIGFEDQAYNEAEHAKAVAQHLGTQHTELFCTTEDAKDIIPLLPDIYDEPFSDYSAIPTYLLSKLTRQHVKVAISADGGDELFIGYRRFINAIKLAEKMQRVPSRILSICGNTLSSANKTGFGENYVKRKLVYILKNGQLHSIPQYQNQKLLNEDINQLLVNVKPIELQQYHIKGDINDIFRIEFQHYLQDEILTKVDRASMACGLESREPILDHELIEWAHHLPHSVKYKNGELKHILKSIAYKYIPKSLLDRPKQGFDIPIMSWIRSDMNWLIDDLLNSDYIKQQGLFQDKTIDVIKKKFYNSKHYQNDKIMWQLIVFQLWYERWMA